MIVQGILRFIHVRRIFSRKQHLPIQQSFFNPLGVSKITGKFLRSCGFQKIAVRIYRRSDFFHPSYFGPLVPLIVSQPKFDFKTIHKEVV